MYLKALELQGFKSFPDKTTLTFDGDITAVVGPNGSGKSNIADAIRWVMGEQSTKALRGGKMEDVIFNGTQKRKRLGYAEVSLILDNTGGGLPREESEVMVTRRYYRSGESEYYINRTSCRLRDIHELFMDTGLGRDGYAMIGQGRIDDILSSRGPERRNLFEEVAGISRFRHRKEEAERKLARTEDNLLRVGDKISELELQVEPLRVQAEKARTYLTLRDELKELEISVWLAQLDRLRQGSRKLLSDWEQAGRQRDEAAAEQEQLYARSEALAVEMQEQERTLEALRQTLTGLDERVQERESAAAVLESEARNNQENARRLSRELDQQEARADSVAGQIARYQGRLEEIQSDWEELRETLSRREEEVRRVNRSAGQLEKELSALLEQNALHSTTAAQSRELLSALAAAEQELLDRDTALKQQLQENADRLTEAEAEADRRREKLTRTREACLALKNTVDGYRLRLESRRRTLEQTTGEANQLAMDENNLRSRIHMLSEMEKLYEGYTKSVKTVMQAVQRGRLQGIHGPVAGLLRTEDRFAVAIEIALGGAKQNIVVDREEDGKAAIEYLKRREGGRATFLPLTTVRSSRLREQGVERHPGFVGVASDLIDCAPQYQAVFARLLGNVVIVDTLDAAIALARACQYRFRIVTLDGQILSPGGSMTGGSVSRRGGILSRAGELERLRSQVGELERRRAEARKKLEQAEREAQAASYELKTARGQKEELDNQALKLEGLCGQTDILLETLRETRDACRGELDQLAHRAEQLERETQRTRQRITELEGERSTLRDALAGKRAGQTSVRERTEAIQSEIADLNVQRASLEAEREATRSALEELRNMERSLSGDQDSRRRQMEAYEAESRSLQERLEEVRTQAERMRGERAEQSRQLAALSRSRMALEARRGQTDRAAREKNQELLNLERECALLEQKKQAAELEEKQILDRLWENYSLTYEDARARRQELDCPQKATRRISELKRSIAKLGSVNVGAVEEFRRVNERYEFLTGQRDDVQKAKAELGRVIDAIAEEMKRIFASQFKRIGNAFAETFRELFGGGKAALVLEDREDILNCDIEIKVQPPGKTLKVLSLLSGGEKAFVAIALYFSFLKVRPAPFVVMDEIEAALDENNVVRFARYMRGLSEKTQFIVITHRRGTMEEADVLYGVTMQEQGISRMLSINLNEMERELQFKEGV